MSQPTTSLISGLHHFALSVMGLPASIAWYQNIQLEFVAIDI